MRRLAFASLVALALASSASARAEVVAVAAKDGRFIADVSARQMSMIAIVGEKVASIRKLDDPHGPQILLEADGATGQVFVGFDGDVVGRSFSAFLLTDSGKTVQAILTPRDIEAATVTVRLNPAEALAPADAAATAQAPAATVAARGERREAYPEVLTALIRLMFNDDAPAGVQRKLLSDPVRRAGAFDLRPLESFSVAGLRGTVLALQNRTAAGQAVIARTFLVAGVLAAAVSHEMIAPGQYGRVYLVEEER